MTDHHDIFKTPHGKRWLADENRQSFTTEDLYQAFKARLMREVAAEVTHEVAGFYGARDLITEKFDLVDKEGVA